MLSRKKVDRIVKDLLIKNIYMSPDRAERETRKILQRAKSRKLQNAINRVRKHSLALAGAPDAEVLRVMRERKHQARRTKAHMCRTHDDPKRKRTTHGTRSPDEIYLWTDGACEPNPGVGGWGALYYPKDHPAERIELCGGDMNTTNNRMELTAAIKGLEAIGSGATVIVYTDSQYLSNAFNKSWINKWERNGWIRHHKGKTLPVLNSDLWKRLKELTMDRYVIWQWIRGHSGIADNERCDWLANHGRSIVIETSVLCEDEIEDELTHLDREFSAACTA